MNLVFETVVIMGYSAVEKFQDNIAAIKIALRFDGNSALSHSDISQLKKYSGFGGLKAVLYEPGTEDSWRQQDASDADMKLRELVNELHELLKSELSFSDYRLAIGSIKNNILTAFYTPDIVPKVLFNVLRENRIFPQKLYEPSAGAGIFIQEFLSQLSQAEVNGDKGVTIVAIEKDIVTAMILKAILSESPVKCDVINSPFESTGSSHSQSSDLVVSNIPFGDIKVFDPLIDNRDLTSHIHNYFFAKGLDKLGEGGILAFITTSAFLNTPGNRPARDYLFNCSDLISVVALPDNLMKDTGNTEAGSHLIITRKNSAKKQLSEAEQELIETVIRNAPAGDYHFNSYVNKHLSDIALGEISEGTNQYGKPMLNIWYSGTIDTIGAPLEDRLSLDFKARFDQSILKVENISETKEGRKFDFLKVPEASDEEPAKAIQGGLFSTNLAGSANRAFDYISLSDTKFISKETAEVVSIIRTTENPNHESFVLIRARKEGARKWKHRIFSNVKQIAVPTAWLETPELISAVKEFSAQLKDYGYDYIYEGDLTLESTFQLKNDAPEPIHRLKSFYENGTLVHFQGRFGVLSNVDKENDQAVFTALQFNDKDSKFLERYIEMRDCYFDLVSKEMVLKIEQGAIREALNERYDDFTGTYGKLNSSGNRNLILKDGAHGLTVLSALERKDGENLLRGDILTGSLVKRKETYLTDDPHEAMAISLNERGSVDLPYIATMLQQDESTTIELLGSSICLNAETRSWEPSDRYLSGNVVEKLEKAEDALAESPEDIFLQHSCAALRQALPDPIPFDLLDFNLGERWIPVRLYGEFVSQVLGTNCEVNFLRSVDVFKVKINGSRSKADIEFTVKTKDRRNSSPEVIFENALENTSPYYTYSIETPTGVIRLPDNEAIQSAHQKIEGIRSLFSEWLAQLPETRKLELQDLYNRTFNCYKLRTYSGDHLKFPGLDRQRLGLGLNEQGVPDLYKSQRDAIWRIIQNRGAIIDHEVGLGKTLLLICAAKEMKRLQIINKPMILALKANVGQIVETFRRAYPTARILAPAKEDFTPSRRKQLFHTIKNNNWDAVIITHDQFSKIPQSLEIQSQIIGEELDNLQKDLDTLGKLGAKVTKEMRKGLEKRKANLTAKLSEITNNIEGKKDQGVSFSDMGVDHIFVDEAHKFKNLTFTTRHNRVAGLGNMEGSQKALNMLFAVRTLQERFNSDLCVTFLSGTPISNSLTEMYLLFKYLRPKELLRQQIGNFDAWAAVYAKKSTDFEFSVTNEIIAKERFRHFIKVPELAVFYSEITDYKTAKNIVLDRPEMEEELINISPTADQISFMDKLIQFAKSGDATLIGRAPLTKEEDKGRMLIATNYAKKMAADMRLVSEHYEDDPGNKVNVCARKVNEWYQKSAEHKGVQIVFSDLGTPKPNEFNLYDALKEKLTRDFNIPASHITFVHDWTDATKKEYIKKLNRGDIRIILGSTDKAGTGLNIQRNVVAMHHLDIPWKPSELEQRNGRGVRAGNWVAKTYYGNKVKSYIYAVERTLDNYKFSLLKNKQLFISQMKNSSLHVRTIDEGAMDEQNGMNFSEYVAILSGDTSLLELSKIEKKIAALEGKKSAYLRDLSRAKSDYEQEKYNLVHAEPMLGVLVGDEQLYKSRLQFDKDGTKINSISLNDFHDPNPESIGNYLIDLRNNIGLTKEERAQGLIVKKIGVLYGFDLFQRTEIKETDSGTMSQTIFYAMSPYSEIKYMQSNGNINIDNPKLAARYFLNAIDRVTSLKEQQEKKISSIKNSLGLLDSVIQKKFDKDTELVQLKTEHADLQKKVSEKLKATNSPSQGQVSSSDVQISSNDPPEQLPTRSKGGHIPRVVDDSSASVKRRI
ncbi:DNA methylase [Chitinophaga varians]|uniref:DNA methylase n=1 Tax=Chitinophaga varians TaxID=2202339 RepID=A0A847S4Z4_9BACT|nr:helicase-related protein [Chitinophaga varians]NLR67907.1 DNA methylase [Chitinophaga varians]